MTLYFCHFLISFEMLVTHVFSSMMQFCWLPRKHGMVFFRLLFRVGQVLNWTNAWLLPLFSSASDFPASCRLIQNVFAGQMCPRARLCLCVNLPTFSPLMAPDPMVVSGIKWTSGPFLSDAGWWAKLKAPRISKLATPSWCAAFMALEKQSEKMRLTWSVEGMQCLFFVVFFLKNSVIL